MLLIIIIWGVYFEVFYSVASFQYYVDHSVDNELTNLTYDRLQQLIVYSKTAGNFRKIAIKSSDLGLVNPKLNSPANWWLWFFESSHLPKPTLDKLISIYKVLNSAFLEVRLEKLLTPLGIRLIGIFYTYQHWQWSVLVAYYKPARNESVE